MHHGVVGEVDGAEQLVPSRQGGGSMVDPPHLLQRRPDHILYGLVRPLHWVRPVSVGQGVGQLDPMFPSKVVVS